MTCQFHTLLEIDGRTSIALGVDSVKMTRILLFALLLSFPNFPEVSAHRYFLQPSYLRGRLEDLYSKFLFTRVQRAVQQKENGREMESYKLDPGNTYFDLLNTNKANMVGWSLYLCTFGFRILFFI